MTTFPQGQPGIPVPDAGETSTADASVPVIPQWFREWGWVPLGFAFVILSLLIADVGRAHGDAVGWFLFYLLLIAWAAAWGTGYSRRLDSARAALRLELRALSCLEAVDAMTGLQFEAYYASLLKALHWTNIEVIGGRAGGDGGVDILATDPKGRRFAIQCKRYAPSKKVDIDGPRRLNGSLAFEHQNHAGLIVTSSELTKPARALAARSGIQVIERPDLAAQMARFREGSGQDGHQAA